MVQPCSSRGSATAERTSRQAHAPVVRSPVHRMPIISANSSLHSRLQAVGLRRRPRGIVAAVTRHTCPRRLLGFHAAPGVGGPAVGIPDLECQQACGTHSGSMMSWICDAYNSIRCPGTGHQVFRQESYCVSCHRGWLGVWIASKRSAPTLDTLCTALVMHLIQTHTSGTRSPCSFC